MTRRERHPEREGAENQSAPREYPKQFSDVDVTFIDGEVKRYRMSAGVTIGRYLAENAAATGILTILNDGVSHGIPINQVREYVILPVDTKAERAAAAHEQNAPAAPEPVGEEA